MHHVCDAGTMPDVFRCTCPVQNDEVVIGCMNAKAGCAGSVMNLLQVDGFNHQVKITQGVLEEECSSMLSEVREKASWRKRSRKRQPLKLHRKIRRENRNNKSKRRKNKNRKNLKGNKSNKNNRSNVTGRNKKRRIKK